MSLPVSTSRGQCVVSEVHCSLPAERLQPSSLKLIQLYEGQRKKKKKKKIQVNTKKGSLRKVHQQVSKTEIGSGHILCLILYLYFKLLFLPH